MDPTKGFITIHSKESDLSFTSFNYKIVCGNVKDSLYDNYSFEFSHTIYHKLFLAFIAIAQVLSGSATYQSGIICYTKDGKYGWQCLERNKKKIIQLNVISHKKLCRQHEMSDIGFNEFIRVIGQLILPSLCVNTTLFPFFREIINFDLNLLLSFQESNVFETFLQTKSKLTEIEKYYALVFLEHNLDSVIAANKILSLFNPNLTFTKQNIELMENY